MPACPCTRAGLPVFPQDTVSIVLFNVVPQLVDIVVACIYLALKLQPWAAVIVFVTVRAARRCCVTLLWHCMPVPVQCTERLPERRLQKRSPALVHGSLAGDRQASKLDDPHARHPTPPLVSRQVASYVPLTIIITERRGLIRKVPTRTCCPIGVLKWPAVAPR